MFTTKIIITALGEYYYHFILFLQVKDLLDDALKERSMVWDNKMRLGIDEEPALGFPSLDEIGKKILMEMIIIILL